ncbi:SCP2 sterol-binding domain-containing protein [Micromonospora sp. NPDC049559]|uniref:SCP2 sterol-binding domain-containing protein n=1 Tax=Micromonospora sp. NPDC049559 TaxID=3155923 RepID=UPI00343F9BBC
MADPTNDFFSRLPRGDHPFLPDKYSGTLRVDLRVDHRTEHWYLTVLDNDVQVSRRSNQADAILQTDKALFDELVSGRRAVKAALLRGAITVEGDLRMLNAFRYLLPGTGLSRTREVRERGRRLAGEAQP